MRGMPTCFSAGEHFYTGELKMEISIIKNAEIEYLNANDFAKILDVLTLEVFCLYKYK